MKPAAPAPVASFDAETRLVIGRFELRPRQRQLLCEQQPVAIGSPTFDLLHCLARHDGQTLAPELLRRSVWPRRKVGENNLRVQLTLLRRLLGDDAIVHHPGVGYRLALPVHPAEAAPSGAQAARPGNLGPQLPPLLGRDAERERLAACLSSHQRVTVLGPAGVGKSALAAAVACDAAPACDDGVWWVELAALTESSQVCEAVAATLQIPLRGTAALDELARALAPRRLLLVLDNCEHMIGAVVALADALITAAPHVRLLATSRRALKCAGEQLLELAPLALPAEAGLAAARRSGAVALFEGRARRADPRFSLTPDNADAVAAICAALDGLPLAITLAAARVPLLGTAALRERLADRLRLLSSREPDAEGRHQSLLAALDWSHGLLSASEQAVLRRLGVFAGSFGLESVKALAGDARQDDWAVLEALHALIDHSLLQTDRATLHDDAPPRYTLHESLRLYARQHLQRSGEAPALRERHARHVLALVQGPASPAGPADNMKPALPDADHDNLRAALAWALDNDVELALELCVSANTWFRQRGHHGEAARLAARLLADPRCARHPSLLARLHLARCAICVELNELDAMKRHVDAALALLQPGDAGLLGHAWAWAGTLHNYRREYHAAEAAWRKALRLHGAAGHRYEAAVTLANIGCQQAERGRHDEARVSLEQALQMHRELATPWGVAVALENLGELDYLQGRYESAQRRWAEALAGFRALRHAYHEALVQCYQAQVLRRLGQADAARQALSASLQVAVPRKFAAIVADAWCVLAGLVLQGGDAGRAAALLQAAQVLRQGEPPLGCPLARDLPEIERATQAALSATVRARVHADAAGWVELVRAGEFAALQAQGLA